MNFLFEKAENFIYDMNLKLVKKNSFWTNKIKKNLSLIMSVKYSHTHKHPHVLNLLKET